MCLNDFANLKVLRFKISDNKEKKNKCLWVRGTNATPPTLHFKSGFPESSWDHQTTASWGSSARPPFILEWVLQLRTCWRAIASFFWKLQNPEWGDRRYITRQVLVHLTWLFERRDCSDAVGSWACAMTKQQLLTKFSKVAVRSKKGDSASSCLQDFVDHCHCKL